MSAVDGSTDQAAPGSDPGAATRRSFVRDVGSVFGLVALGVALSWWASHWVFPAYSWNRDEPVYLWQMATLRSGNFSTPDGGFPEFFHPWLSVAQGGRLYSQYTLGWPLVLLFGDVVFGSPAAGLAIGAALAISGTYAFTRALTGDRAHALVAAGAMTLSPIIVVQGGVYLGYLFTLGLGTFFGAALVTGLQMRSRRRLVVAGLLLGAIFLTRPFDAFVWAGAIGVTLVVQQRREWRRLLAASGWCALGALPLFAVTLLYNRHMTGSLGTFPVTLKDPLDTYGFGTRRIAPEFSSVDYGIVQAVKGTLKNGAYLLVFSVGGLVALPVALLGMWQRRRESTTWLLAVLALAFPAGYFFFWGTNVSSLTSRISGPIYFVPMYAPLSFFIAAVVVSAARRNRRAGALVATVIVLAGVPLAANRIATNRRISEAQVPWQRASDAVRDLDHDSLVFVADSGPYLMFLNPYSANDPDLAGKVLWSTERLGHDIDLIDAHQDRVAYRMQASYRGDELGPAEHPKVPEVELIPLEKRAGATLQLEAQITNSTDHPFVTVTVMVDGRVVAQEALSTDSRRGDSFSFSWSLTGADQTELGSPGVTHLVSEYGSVVVGVGYGDNPRSAARPIVQRIMGYRNVDSVVTTVVPARGERLSDIGGPKLRWRPTTDLPEIALAVDAP